MMDMDMRRKRGTERDIRGVCRYGYGFMMAL
jgi:hypothetical protein